MKPRTIGIILMVISAFFILGSIKTLMETKEETANLLKKTYERQGIFLSDVEIAKLNDNTYMYMRISSYIFLILFIWIGYVGYNKFKTKNLLL